MSKKNTKYNYNEMRLFLRKTNNGNIFNSSNFEAYSLNILIKKNKLIFFWYRRGVFQQEWFFETANASRILYFLFFLKKTEKGVGTKKGHNILSFLARKRRLPKKGRLN